MGTMDYLMRDIGIWLDALIAGQTPRSVMGVALVMGGLALLLFALRSHRRQRREPAIAAVSEAPATSVLEKMLRQQASMLALLGERLLAVEEYLELVGNRQQSLEADKRDIRFYQQAIKLADEGLSSAELTQRCGLSSAEAELITALQRRAG